MIARRVIMISHPFKGSPTHLQHGRESLPHATYQDRHAKRPSLPPRTTKTLQKLLLNRSSCSGNGQSKRGSPYILTRVFPLESADWKGNDPKPLKAYKATEMAKMPYYYVMPLNASMPQAVALSMADEDPKEVFPKRAYVG